MQLAYSQDSTPPRPHPALSLLHSARTPAPRPTHSPHLGSSSRGDDVDKALRLRGRERKFSRVTFAAIYVDIKVPGRIVSGSGKPDLHTLWVSARRYTVKHCRDQGRRRARRCQGGDGAHRERGETREDDERCAPDHHYFSVSFHTAKNAVR